MPRYADIAAITDSVLASVREDEALEKTASSEQSETLKTEIGQGLKSAAEKIRAFEDTSVTRHDVGNLVAYTKQALLGQLAGTAGGALAGGMLGGPLGAIAGGYMGNKMMAPNKPVNQAAGAAVGPAPGMGGPPKMGSYLGNELRKIAQQVREQGAANQEIRLTKAAQMLTAAVGLQHLTEGLK